MKKLNIFKALGPIMKTLGLAVLVVIALLAASPRAWAYSSQQDQQAAWFAQEYQSKLKIADSLQTVAVSTVPSLMNIWYTGPATAAYMNVAGSNGAATYVTFYAPFNVIDTTIGNATYGITGGTIDLTASSATTLGGLCDLINGVGPFSLNGAANGGSPTGGSYHCVLTDGIRSDPTQTLVPAITQTAGINNLMAQGGYNVPFSTNTIMSLGIIPATGKHVVLNYCQFNVAGTPKVQIFGVPAKNGAGLSQFGVPLNDDNLVYQSPALVANTSTYVPLTTPIQTPWMEFGGSSAFKFFAPGSYVPVGNTMYDGHVVVRTNGVSAGYAQNTNANWATCNWSEK